MSALLTTLTDHLPGRTDEETISPALRLLRTADRAPEAKPARYPVVGAVALDAMATIAGPAATPGHESAWRAAFEIVMQAMRAGRPSSAVVVS
jgi:hemoglobin-like flavoprotein